MNNLSARALAIIEILKKLSHPVSSLALSEEIGCSTKTIQSEIKDINKQLKDTKIVSIRGVGYKLEGKVVAMPRREEIDTPIAEHLIVELYSK